MIAPTTHFVSLAQAILYRNAGFDVVWPSFVWLLGIASVFFYVSWKRFPQRHDSYHGVKGFPFAGR